MKLIEEKLKSKLALLLSLFLLFPHVNSHSIFCNKDSDCPILNYCGSKQLCVHKSLIPIDKFEYIGFIVIFLGSAISNAGGIGGGGLLIPILLVFFSFEAEEAIPLSKIMIFGGALTSFLLGFKIKHPIRNQISIDYNIPMILIPLLLFGTMTGVILSKVIHHNVILISLTLFLVINAITTTSKGIKQYQRETEELERNEQNGDSKGQAKDRRSKYIIRNFEEEEDYGEDERLNLCQTYQSKSKEADLNKSSDDIVNKQVFLQKQESIKNIQKQIFSHTPLLKIPKRYSQSQNLPGSLRGKINSISLRHMEELDIEYKKDLEKFPLDKYFYMLLCFAVMIVVTLMKGTTEFKSFINIQQNSIIYWAIFFSYFLFAVIINFVISKKILAEYDYRKRKGYEYNEYDVKWTNKILILYPLFGFMCGMFAGLLGIGGGLIMGPLLLDLGLHPVVSTATSNFLVLFISSSTSIQFIFMGMLNYNYAYALVIVSSVGSLVGTLLIQKLFFATGRSSVLVLVLASVLGIAAIVIPIHSVYKYMHIKSH